MYSAMSDTTPTPISPGAPSAPPPTTPTIILPSKYSSVKRTAHWAVSALITACCPLNVTLVVESFFRSKVPITSVPLQSDPSMTLTRHESVSSTAALAASVEPRPVPSIQSVRPTTSTLTVSVLQFSVTTTVAGAV
eukprot:Blabericola_migrator_1__7659@NODE_3909_length_1434_cov_628_213606_g2414_i0_p2_GENE_NODE_3909_length_1434_cov_628_213606_g2414_i0NODE_3909_length_1434_cov_628_213606_g2414_i0_p2_ORF_typecomplete_len136_score20_55TAP35_44/PF07265_11/0_04MerE/PF05052_12/0_11_NODE_3909_length_1434_cov_628_213606_g2414_i06971104